ncbi:RNA polymerase Rpb3/Rpb11 dimerization domain-domain-containing protein [Leucosporidium creatinivorum]|uniref:DNA-directed RNA polymerases I and III subunit RPAC2 n=1 Tax=Leucosporidium creatinivorum TaxID=106004 RepID=A0A1Y2G4T4_9BASI|nr:RNA polymerase Rpb3/Rpb11 dimerization domain-domain-containing protein [Leucosporidium creatinivorum]
MSHEATPALSEDAPRADKIIALPGYTEGYTAATYCIQDEDHTLGNLLRWMIMKNPDVEFCGYSAPHPSEPKIHIRIQMYDEKSSLTALHTALDQLESMTESILAAYQASLASGDYDRPTDLEYDFESVNQRLWEEKEAQGRGSREEWEAEKAEKEKAVKEEEDKKKAGGKKGKSGR